MCDGGWSLCEALSKSKKIAINMHNRVCDTIRFGAKWHIIYNDLFYIPSSRPTMYRCGAPAPPTSLSKKPLCNHISWVHSNALVYVAGLSEGDADPFEFSHKTLNLKISYV